MNETPPLMLESLGFEPMRQMSSSDAVAVGEGLNKSKFEAANHLLFDVLGCETVDGSRQLFQLALECHVGTAQHGSKSVQTWYGGCTKHAGEINEMFLPSGFSPEEDVEDRRTLMVANKPEYMQWRLYHACCARDILIAKARNMRLVPHPRIGRFDGKGPHKCSSYLTEQA